MSNTQDKLREANYFLQLMAEHSEDTDKFRYDLSAFVSAFRSVTFLMQKEHANHADFRQWYAGVQDRLKSDRKVQLLQKAVVVQFDGPRSETISSTSQMWSVRPVAIAGVFR